MILFWPQMSGTIDWTICLFTATMDEARKARSAEISLNPVHEGNIGKNLLYRECYTTKYIPNSLDKHLLHNNRRSQNGIGKSNRLKFFFLVLFPQLLV